MFYGIVDKQNIFGEKMVKIFDIEEAFSLGKMREPNDKQYLTTFTNFIKTAKKVIDISSSLSLYLYGNMYILTKNEIPLGHIMLEDVNIAGEQYKEVKIIFIREEFRKTSALYWLLYGVKESINVPVIADGAIFSDGKQLIDVLQKHKYLNIFKMNVNTGKIYPLTEPINDSDYCYLFKSANLGFGKKINEDMEFNWHILFEEIEEE